jgi:chemotaxis protein CheY-P-specific phosphatase CheC
MITAIDSATKSFCADIIGLETKQAKYSGKNFYGAAIALCENQIETQWYLLFKKNTLNEFSKALLFEDDLNEDDLDDLVKEVANMIVGSAKVILEEKNSNSTYKISTPDFLGHVPRVELLKLEEFLLYKIKNRTFVVGRT